eukprot:scaffold119000_cov22-Tisochrysis_lutea.AAC.1
MAGPNIEWTARCSMAVPCQKESVGLCHVMELQWVCLRAAVAVPLLEKCEDEDVRRLYRGCWSACFVIRRSCTCGSEALPKPGVSWIEAVRGGVTQGVCQPGQQASTAGCIWQFVPCEGQMIRSHELPYKIWAWMGTGLLLYSHSSLWKAISICRHTQCC